MFPPLQQHGRKFTNALLFLEPMRELRAQGNQLVPTRRNERQALVYQNQVCEDTGKNNSTKIFNKMPTANCRQGNLQYSELFS